MADLAYLIQRRIRFGIQILIAQLLWHLPHLWNAKEIKLTNSPDWQTKFRAQFESPPSTPHLMARPLIRAHQFW